MTFRRAIPRPAVALTKEDATCVVPISCSMKITEDVRKFAAEQKVSDEEALKTRMEEKAREFKESGAEIYAKT
jgi:hypothetical protein